MCGGFWETNTARQTITNNTTITSNHWQVRSLMVSFKCSSMPHAFTTCPQNRGKTKPLTPAFIGRVRMIKCSCYVNPLSKLAYTIPITFASPSLVGGSKPLSRRAPTGNVVRRVCTKQVFCRTLLFARITTGSNARSLGRFAHFCTALHWSHFTLSTSWLDDNSQRNNG